MLALPVMCDQDANAGRLQELNVALTLDFTKLTESTFKDAIQEITTNKK